MGLPSPCPASAAELTLLSSGFGFRLVPNPLDCAKMTVKKLSLLWT